MINNYWEEKNLSKNITEFQEKELQRMNIPKWMNVKCPYCHQDLPLRSIRSVSLKFNTRNMGDVVVEVLCEDCCKMDSVYFRQEANNIPEFISLLNNNKIPVSNPVLEEVMYKLQYNNVIEKMIKSNGDK